VNLHWEMVSTEYSDAELSDLLGVTRQRIHAAKKKGDMPAHWAAQIHRATEGRIRAEKLRPDIFGGVI